MAEADRQFGDPWRLRRLTDRAGVLRNEQREQVQLAMGRFSRRFPQLFFAVYTGTAGTLEDLRPFGFWLLNRAVFDDVPIDMPNEAGILLLIDPEHHAACLTYGYALDPHLDEDCCFDCLARAHGHWIEGRYADGVIKLLEQLERVLIRRARRARRRGGRRSSVPSPAGKPDEARLLREGHRSREQRREEEV